MLGKESATVVTAFIFGCTACYFSYLAYRHTREKFRLDLFEKRYELYKSIIAVHQRIEKGQYGLQIDNELRMKYGESLSLSKFIFDKDIAELIQHIADAMQENSRLNLRAESSTENRKEAFAKRDSSLIKTKEYISQFDDAVKPYIDFSMYKNF